jgi:outer membrane protein assembly factor BamB
VVSSAGLLGAYRLDNGQRVWEQRVASMGMLFVSGDTLFLISTDDTLAALNRMDGRTYWSVQLPRYKKEEDRKGRYRWSGPTLAGGKIYVAGAHGEMRVFDASNGAELPAISIPDDVYSAPVVAGGVMYLTSANAKLHALY